MFFDPYKHCDHRGEYDCGDRSASRLSANVQEQRGNDYRDQSQAADETDVSFNHIQSRKIFIYFLPVMLLQKRDRHVHIKMLYVFERANVRIFITKVIYHPDEKAAGRPGRRSGVCLYGVIRKGAEGCNNLRSPPRRRDLYVMQKYTTFASFLHSYKIMNSKVLLLLTVGVILTSTHSLSQIVRFDFPRLSGRTYTFSLAQGYKQDTIARGKLDTQGKASVPVFELKPGFAGMARLSFEDRQGIEFLLSKESFTIASNSDRPAMENVRFEGSEENEFLFRTFSEKQRSGRLLAWAQAGLELVDVQKTLLREQLQKEFTEHRIKMQQTEAAIAQSSLYAGWFMRNMDFFNRMADAEYRQNEQDGKWAMAYMRDTMNFDLLHTGGQFWQQIFTCWTSLCNKQLPAETKEISFGMDVTHIINRIKKDDVRQDFIDIVIHLCEEYGWNKTEEGIIACMIEKNIPYNPETSIGKRLEAMYKVRRGEKAPEIVGFASTTTPSKRLLIFYETGCDHCEREIQQIRQHYPALQTQQIEVISIASDTDRQIFETGSATFPWQARLCDLKGFAGENFKNYGVMGTPTIFEIDEAGLIVGRHAKFSNCTYRF
jgi:hypothetical protein